MSDIEDIVHVACPLPRTSRDFITLAHGGGGKLSSQLIKELIAPIFGTALALHDSAILAGDASNLAFTTDSYVVRPRFFPGGDIGSLAVYGTANDLAVVGAKPLALSCSLIIEEGFAIAELKSILTSMKAAADLVGVSIVTGDTKVVERGSGDGLYINTSGVGQLVSALKLEPRQIQVGDQLIVSGDLGRHGACILSARHELDTVLESDCGYVGESIQNLMKNSLNLHCLRDLTRGGLVSALMELSEASQLSFRLLENAIPVNDEVSAICQLLGLEGMHLANEGRYVIFSPASETDKILSMLRSYPGGESAACIGEVVPKSNFSITLVTPYGTERIVTQTLGEQLPRIC